MNARHILFCLALSLLGTGLQAQSDLPQVFSPNAAELGKYGKIPVSYFNGLPNISIPLTELRAKGYTLPIYLTYHAGGNKPDQHPGWVGLGWTLHAGGCINRIVNGKKDEMSREEETGLPGVGIGYYFHTQDMKTGTKIDSLLNSLAFNWDKNDYQPDEFIINVEGLQASFYIVGENEVRIVSKTDSDFEVQFELETEPSNFPGVEIIGDYVYSNVYRSYKANRYTYFKGFTVTDKTGVRYIFGGDDSAIEYSVVTKSFATPYSYNTHWSAVATANTWYLKRIERPDGETISFEYIKEGTPMVLIDRHHGEYFYPLDQNLQARLGYYDESTFRGDKYNSNYHITFLQPSYLTRISAQKAGDEILFSRSVTQELDYQITDNQFISAVGDFSEDGETLGQFTLPKFLENDYYMRLSEIQKPSNPRFHICFDHSADTTRRLTLNQIRFYEGTSTPSYKYYFDYNESQLLPAYNSKQTDYWGYYNGRSFKTSNVQESYLIDGKRSQIDSLKMRAEILTCIHYPTGGYTEFQYEPHDYRQVVRQFPFYLQELNGDTQCGGLRIRAIKDYPLEGHPEMRTFHYKKGNKSSGILSGYPKNYDGDEHYMMTRYYYNYGNGMLLGTGEYEVSFKIYSEDAVNELSTTEGNHVTYSQVIEMRGDGSSVVYTYSNHDTENGLDTSPRFYDTNYGTAVLSSKGNSRSLFRGLLLNETGKDRFGDTTYLKQNTYSIDTVSCVHSLGRTAYCGNSLYSIFHHTIFCAFPYMSNHRVSVWSEAGNDPHVEITEYAFDSHRRLTETRRTVGGVTERETFSYTGNYSVRPYSGMKTKNMISYPVEHMKYRMDAPSSELLVSAELTTWREGPGGRYVPSAKYLAELGPGVLPSNFTPYATTDNVLIGYPAPEVIYSRTDSLGNILESVSRDGVHSAYLWNKSGVYPEMVARNANRKEFRTVNHSEEGVLDYMISEGPTNPIETFVITGPGTLILDLGTTAGQDWGITLEVTGIRTVALGSHGIQENVNNALEDYVNASSHAFIPLPAGSHSVCILEAVNYFSGGDPEEEAPELEYTLTWDTETVTGYDDVFHEDFEPDTVQSGASQVGFHSYGYYTGGNYTFELDTDPDKQYILDYRIKQNNGAWQYVRSNLTYSANGNYTIQVGTAKLDEVRVYPADSEAESYTWDAAGNLLSKTDARGVTESYEYDGLGRLVFIRDNDGNYVEHYEYNYQNR